MGWDGGCPTREGMGREGGTEAKRASYRTERGSEGPKRGGWAVRVGKGSRGKVRPEIGSKGPRGRIGDEPCS